MIITATIYCTRVVACVLGEYETVEIVGMVIEAA